MTDRPIIFSTPMVRALLDGRKTQTRRVVKDQTLYRDTPAQTREVIGETGEVWTGFMGWQFISTALANRGICGKGCLPPYAPGDRLWVRETWAEGWETEDTTWPIYAAQYGERSDPCYKGLKPWRSSMFMPRKYSRLTLIVTDVRVQRLQQISEADAQEEGCDDGELCRPVFRRLWDGLNTARGYGWDANPWVVAVTFTVERRNIDEVPA